MLTAHFVFLVYCRQFLKQKVSRVLVLNHSKTTLFIFTIITFSLLGCGGGNNDDTTDKTSIYFSGDDGEE